MIFVFIMKMEENNSYIKLLKLCCNQKIKTLKVMHNNFQHTLNYFELYNPKI